MTEKIRQGAAPFLKMFLRSTEFMIEYTGTNLRKGSENMIQLDQIKSDLPAVKANLKEAGESL